MRGRGDVTGHSAWKQPSPPRRGSARTAETERGEYEQAYDATSRALKEAVYARWASDNCEDAVDTLRTVSAVDHDVPFVPMEPRHLVPVAALRLDDTRASYLRRRHCALTWAERGDDGAVARAAADAASTSVLRHLASKVDFDGPYAIEGAYGVANVVKKHVARAMRAIEPKLAEWKAARQGAEPHDANAEALARLLGGSGGAPGAGAALPVVELRVVWMPEHDAITGAPTGAKAPALEARVL